MEGWEEVVADDDLDALASHFDWVVRGALQILAPNYFPEYSADFNVQGCLEPNVIGDDLQ